MRVATRRAASRLERGSSKRKSFGRAHDGAADGDALALAAGELGRAAGEERLEREHLRGGGDALVDEVAGGAGLLEAEGHVVADGEVRVERVGLEDHGDLALAGRRRG